MINAIDDTIRELELAHVLGLDRGDQSWRQDALCGYHPDPDIFFPEPHQVDLIGQALALCHRCAVRAQCLEDAIECKTEYGIRGGYTEQQLVEIIHIIRDDPGMERVRAFLTGETIQLNDGDMRAAIRVAQLAGVPSKVWAAPIGLSRSAAKKRRQRANYQIANIPVLFRADEIWLADELRAAASATVVAA